MMLAVAAVVMTAVASISDVPSPRPTGWVSDVADVLDATAERQINTIVEQLHHDRGVEVAVVTVDDVAGTPKQFASALFKHWRIGSSETNNGVLVLLAVDRRRIEIETGTGIEAALTAAWLASMETESMVPRFRTSDFSGGLVAGIRAIDEHIRNAPAESTSTAPRGEYRSNAAPTDEAPPPSISDAPATDPRWGFLLGGGAAFLGLGVWLGIRRFLRRGTCSRCIPPRAMIELDEAADDEFLDPGQRTEERVGSEDYAVLLCPGCRTVRIRRKWRGWSPWSGYQPCAHCTYKTSRTIHNTVRAASESAPGEVEVSTACAHCGHTESYRYAIPQLVELSSSSSSSSSFSAWSSGDSFSDASDDSSSGFSGGDSDGGGAGSSW